MLKNEQFSHVTESKFNVKSIFNPKLEQNYFLLNCVPGSPVAPLSTAAGEPRVIRSLAGRRAVAGPGAAVGAAAHVRGHVATSGSGLRSLPGRRGGGGGGWSGRRRLCGLFAPGIRRGVPSGIWNSRIFKAMNARRALVISLDSGHDQSL